MTAGRKTKFKEEYCHQAFIACSQLKSTDKQLAALFDVKESTINNWKIDFPQFLESIKAGKAEADNEVERSLFERATGYTCKDVKFATHEGQITDFQEYDKHFPPDVTAAIFWLKNRKPKQWRDKQEIDYTEKTKIVDDFGEGEEICE